MASLSWVAKKELPILFVIEDNDFAVLTKKEDRRDWKAKDIAKAFKIKSFDVTDNPVKIYQKLASYKFNYPALINIRTNRLYWHSGAGKDSENVFDRTKSEIAFFKKKGQKLFNLTKKRIDKIWKSRLEK